MKERSSLSDMALLINLVITLISRVNESWMMYLYSGGAQCGFLTLNKPISRGFGAFFSQDKELDLILQRY